MHVFYINVAKATARRAAIEQDLAAKLPADWPWTRVEAVTPATLDAARCFAGLSPGENACYQSHLAALRLAAASGGPALIVEDDAQFARRSAAVIDAVIADLAPDDWDFVFSDVAIPDAQPMLRLFQVYREARTTGRGQLLDLRQLPFCGSTAYVVNPVAIDRIVAEAGTNPHALPYDLMLRQAVYEERLQGRLIFPFATTVSAAGDDSQIQGGALAAERIWNAYRRLVWIGKGGASAASALDALPAGFVDAEAEACGRILAAALSRDLAPK